MRAACLPLLAAQVVRHNPRMGDAVVRPVIGISVWEGLGRDWLAWGRGAAVTDPPLAGRPRPALFPLLRAEVPSPSPVGTCALR